MEQRVRTLLRQTHCRMRESVWLVESKSDATFVSRVKPPELALTIAQHANSSCSPIAFSSFVDTPPRKPSSIRQRSSLYQKTELEGQHKLLCKKASSQTDILYRWKSLNELVMFKSSANLNLFKHISLAFNWNTKTNSFKHLGFPVSEIFNL